MAFTYDPNLATDRDWIRFQITDTIENSGPRLESRNYSDEEIAALLVKANGSKELVVAQIFDVLATEWIQMAISYTIGPRKEEIHRLAELYRKQADHWAVVVGFGYRTFSAGFYRAGSRDHSEHT